MFFSHKLYNFSINVNAFDLITGYRADDSYFSYAKDFLNNVISVSQLSQAMKLGELGEQIVLMSPKAFDKIKFIEYLLCVIPVCFIISPHKNI